MIYVHPYNAQESYTLRVIHISKKHDFLITKGGHLGFMQITRVAQCFRLANQAEFALGFDMGPNQT